MPVDVQTWRVRVGAYNAGRLSAFRSRYARPKSIEKMKGSDVAGGCGTVLFGLVMVLSLPHDLFRGRLEFIGTIRVRCGSTKWVSSMKMANVTCGVAVLLFGLAMALCLLLLMAGDVERNPGPDGATLTMEDLPVLVTKLKEIAGQWHPLGVQLKFLPGILDGFPSAIQAEPTRALQQLLTHWLQRKDPPPTLEALGLAVGGPVIGNELLAGTLLEQREDFPSLHTGQAVDATYHANANVSDRPSDDDVGTSASNGTDGQIESPGAFWCPCGKCSLDSFLLNGCPQVCSSSAPDPHFPYLDTKGLSPEDKEDLEHKLIKEAKEMIKKFSSLIDDTSVSLTAQGVTHKRLINNLVHGVVSDHKEEISQAHSIEDIFIVLGKRCYWSFLDYEILETVITKFGSASDKELLENYHRDFKDFCKRSVFQVPYTVYSSKKVTRPKFAVKLAKNTLKLEEVFKVKRKIAESLEVKSSVLHLCCVEDGCVKLQFSVPEYIAKKIFPPSPSQLAALAEASVQFLEYDKEQYICQVHPLQESIQSQSTVTKAAREMDPDMMASKEMAYFDPDFKIHTSYHNSFFILRTPIHINGLPVQIRSTGQGPLLSFTQSGVTISVKLWEISRLVCPIFLKYGVYNVDTFYYDQCPLFQVAFPSKASLKRFLLASDTVSSEVESALTGMFTQRAQSSESGEALGSTPLNVQAKVELFLATPNHEKKKTPTIHPITLSNFSSCTSIWKNSEVFEFGREFAMYCTSTAEEDDLAVPATVEPVTMVDFLKELEDVNDWFHFGIFLRVPISTLEAIEQEYRTPKEQKTRMLIEWDRVAGLTWAGVVQALVGMGRIALATHIGSKYGVSVSDYVDKQPSLEQNVTSEEEQASAESQAAAIEKLDEIMDGLSKLQEKVGVLHTRQCEQFVSKAEKKIVQAALSMVDEGEQEIIQLKIELKAREEESQSLRQTVNDLRQELAEKTKLLGHPIITEQPRSLEDVFRGTTLTFTIQATGPQPLKYHWERKETARVRWRNQWKSLSSDMGRIQGVETDTLTIDKIQKSDVGKYRCIVSNYNGSETSEPATLQLAKLPVRKPIPQEESNTRIGFFRRVFGQKRAESYETKPSTMSIKTVYDGEVDSENASSDHHEKMQSFNENELSEAEKRRSFNEYVEFGNTERQSDEVIL